MSAINSDCQVLFVGAGPVALFTAIQVKLREPDIPIALMDRFNEYVRSQTLVIEPLSLKTACDLSLLKQQRPEYANQIDAFAQLILDLKTHKKIKINQLESRLNKIAEELNIVVHRGYIFDAEEEGEQTQRHLRGIERLKQAFPNAKLIIGSDGAHSKVRKAVFPDDLRIDEGLQYTLAVKYWVMDQSDSLSKLVSYPTQKIAGFTQEHVGRYDVEKNATPINVQFFVDKATFEKFQAYRAGNPLPFEKVKEIDPCFEEKIKTWLSVRREQLGDIIEGEIDVYSIKLSVYQSRQVIHQEGDCTFCFVGDALFGVPFFKSINNGLLCGSKLSKAIVKTLRPSSRPPSLWKRIRSFVHTVFLSRAQVAEWRASPLRRYAVYTEKLANREILWARIKNVFLNGYQWFLDVSARVPWQVNKWSAYDVNRFIEFDYSHDGHSSNQI
ncbi:FAD-dependent oxidoreductase [Candidatus Protochlamydia phocaeensis]|uniref:FAD-dependent oxidoreductase n=1 Tax=Candidatus Protochlamydia phocaeensis TaxID=1414722 RepID=UPI000838E9EC|nr:hypothetical protein [Candidatus Protochlamydia phocaeensis]